jgi:hypothetical protein
MKNEKRKSEMVGRPMTSDQAVYLETAASLLKNAAELLRLSGEPILSMRVSAAAEAVTMVRDVRPEALLVVKAVENV